MAAGGSGRAAEDGGDAGACAAGAVAAGEAAVKEATADRGGAVAAGDAGADEVAPGAGDADADAGVVGGGVADSAEANRGDGDESVGQPSSYYMYVVVCADGSLYTGYAVDVKRRVAQHNAGRGAKYTRSRRPVRLVAAARFATQHEALAAEYRFKRISRVRKVQLIERARGLAAEGDARTEPAAGSRPSQGAQGAAREDAGPGEAYRPAGFDAASASARVSTGSVAALAPAQADAADSAALESAFAQVLYEAFDLTGHAVPAEPSDSPEAEVPPGQSRSDSSDSDGAQVERLACSSKRRVPNSSQ